MYSTRYRYRSGTGYRYQVLQVKYQYMYQVWHTSLPRKVHTFYMSSWSCMYRALLDFDGAEPGTTNKESENLRSWPRSHNIDIINISIKNRAILPFYNVSCSLHVSDTWFAGNKQIYFLHVQPIFFFIFDLTFFYESWFFFDPIWVPCENAAEKSFRS